MTVRINHDKNLDKYELHSDYDKYQKFGDIHWQWYDDNTHKYRTLVDESIKPFGVAIYDQKRPILIDIGCGDGVPMNLLDKLGYRCYGVDNSELGIKIALMQHNVNGEYFIEKAEDFAKRDFHADYLYSLNTIEHLDNPKCMVDIMKKVKRFGIIITDDASKVIDRSIYHTHEFTREEFKELFKDFELEEIKLSDENYFGFKIFGKG